MARAEQIGSLLFCPICGTLLDLPKDSEMTITCDQCGHDEPASSYENIKIRTQTHPDAFPSALRQKRKTQTKSHEGADLGTFESNEKCPVCGHLGAYGKDRQMRSADEGSTVFYACAADNRHTWRQNN
ncbi:hypothetical protein CYLTODRAFT_427368 [Cylindrobasidium torrendii FP15055 ss-10]|uniref:DNA-directed RNA polymerase subunit n=1 Tax=Cylindrobasidium torrendii FP15055 ss-10 TaxID=1314674 RepID=A0A0D7AWU3_9AGAR|nr:hypothetical protein CYLTODRAFT_427368 [Cylindrobasidium torrendii FP15055 ss-10]